MNSTTKFAVEAVATDVLFGTGSVSYSIPRFQRSYAWTREQIDELLTDLFEELDLTVDDAMDSPYFLGSIVLAASDEVDQLHVLDGQQRLTTISLILSTIAANLKRLGSDEFGDISKHLVVGKAGKEKRPILTLQEDDHQLYERILADALADLPKSASRTKIARAVVRIREELARFVADAKKAGSSEENAYWRMAHQVLYGVTFVRIIAPSEAAAFELFETLNDRGLELSAADLVKNKLLAKSTKSTFQQVVDAWDDVVQIVGPTEIVNFLRFYWIAFQGFVRKARLYKEYNEKLKSMDAAQTLTLVRDLKNHAISYRHIDNPDPDDASWPEQWPPELAGVLQRLNDFKARSCRPLLLATASDPEALHFAARFAETMTLRHSVMGDGNANTLERGYDRACKMLREDYGVRAALRDSLGADMPSNETFLHDAVQARMGRANDAWRRILLELNASISTGETEVLGAKKVNIEHILPQSLSPGQLRVLGIAEEEHQDLVGALGNLTLIHAKKNAQASNRTFDEKRTLYGSSEVNLTKRLVNYESYGPSEIRARTHELAEMMLEVWPEPNYDVEQTSDPPSEGW